MGGVAFGNLSGINNNALVTIAAGPYTVVHHRTGAPVRMGRLDQSFLTFPGEITNAQVDVIASYMGLHRKYGIFGLDRQHGPLLIATGADAANPDSFDLVDPSLYPKEFGIVDWTSQQGRERYEQLRPTMNEEPFQIIPDKDRYEKLRSSYADEWQVFAKDEMAATMINYWQAQALSLFAAGALGFIGHTSNLLTSPQFDAIVNGLKYMTRSGELEEGGEPQRAYDLDKIVAAHLFPFLHNGILPNTTWNWTRTQSKNRDGGEYSSDWERIISIVRGCGWWDSLPVFLASSHLMKQRPDHDAHWNGFRIGLWPDR